MNPLRRFEKSLCCMAVPRVLAVAGRARSPAPSVPSPQPPAPPPAGPQEAAERPAGAAAAGQPRPYNRVITAAACTQRGLFGAHQVGERVYSRSRARSSGAT
jgi:hypothetical protein